MTNRWGNSGNSDRLYFGGSKITADGDCSHEIKRRLLLGRKAMTNLDSILKKRNITLLTKVHLITDGKSQLIGKDPDAGKDWRQEKGMTEDKKVGWHHWLDEYEPEQALGICDGQGMAYCNPWSQKESDTAERLNWTELNEVKVTQLHLTLCSLMDCSPSGSSVHGILRARILEWVAIPFSRGSFQPKGQTWVSCIAGRFFTMWATWEGWTGSLPNSHVPQSLSLKTSDVIIFGDRVSKEVIKLKRSL